MIKLCEYCCNKLKPLRRNSKYCSFDCYTKARRKDVVKIELTCIVCGKNFHMGEKENWTRKTCGGACHSKLQFQNKLKFIRTGQLARSKSGCVGVSKLTLYGLDYLTKPWIASISGNQKKRLHKYFATKEEAIAQRKAWEREFGYTEKENGNEK